MGTPLGEVTDDTVISPPDTTKRYQQATAGEPREARPILDYNFKQSPAFDGVETLMSTRRDVIAETRDSKGFSDQLFNSKAINDSILRNTDTDALISPSVALSRQQLDVSRSLEVNRSFFDQFRLTADVASDSTATTNKRLLVLQKQLFGQAMALQALLTFNQDPSMNTRR